MEQAKEKGEKLLHVPLPGKELTEAQVDILRQHSEKCFIGL